MNPATMDQGTCDRFLSGEYEGLRRTSAQVDDGGLLSHTLCLKTPRKDRECLYREDGPDSCHGLGYVPKVDLEGLAEAIKPQHMWIVPVEKDQWRVLIGGTGESSIGEGDTPLLASCRAAVAVKQEAS